MNRHETRQSKMGKVLKTSRGSIETPEKPHKSDVLASPIHQQSQQKVCDVRDFKRRKALISPNSRGIASKELIRLAFHSRGNKR
jgi:hypothetical protein